MKNRYPTQWKDLGIPNKIRKALHHLGMKTPTPIQRKLLPFAIIGRNTVAIAPAGSGKTHAYLIPLLFKMRSPESKTLILVPTRELAFQVSRMLRDLNEPFHRKCLVLVGGNAHKNQELRFNEGWQIIIATPGRLLEFLEKEAVLLQPVNLFIIDEYDKLLLLGFREQVQKIESAIPFNAQRMWLSATEPEESNFPTGIKYRTIRFGLKSSPTICEEYLFFLSNARLKNRLCLEALCQSQSQVIIFVGNRKKANHLNGFLKLNGRQSSLLHGKMKQAERSRVFQSFIEGKSRIMVATDIAGRGLDTLNVDLVINFNLPRNATDYLHRKGRAGRMGRRGRCLSYAGPDEYLALRSLEKGLNYTIPAHPGYGDRKTWLAKARLNHKRKADREKRIEEIRKAQGIG